MVRRRYGGQVVEEQAKDVIATAYRHTTARGVSGAEAPDPQLHTHVVITGAVREDDRIVAVASRPVFRGLREVGAFYRSALAQELAGEGYPIEQGTGKDGKYFEIAGVPAALRDAFSKRHREIARGSRAVPRQARPRARTRRDPRYRAREPPREGSHDPRRSAARLGSGQGSATGSGRMRRCIWSVRPRPRRRERPIEERIEAKLTEREAMFDAGLLRAVALEQTAGELGPEEAIELTRAMVGERRILTLEGGRMTTLAVRAQEQAIERRADELARPAGRDVGRAWRARSRAREVAERIGAPLSREQEHGAAGVDGPGAPRGAGRPGGDREGCRDRRRRTRRAVAGREVIGVAVSGSTAERLGADSPALAGPDADPGCARRAREPRQRSRSAPTRRVILDEAGMVDHKRMDALTELIERSGAKLIAVGDGKQLPSIGPGGMFDRLAHHAPTAELAGHPPHERPGRAQSVGGAARRGTRAGDGALPAPAASCFFPTPANRQARPPSTLGRADRDARSARSR